ncbi:MAG: hypothetical protein IPM79_35960 [Polyangiaceae bacterium]|jgi:hypothetical protein|nr:hypothetical protein [Polyangiaceae bacterium]MBK8942853.1 hypothetical protein [Polyangiaceae bacterium]
MRSVAVPLCALALSCSSKNAPAYATAAAAVAVNVAAAAINRAATNECVAQCSYGTRCNHDTGFCEPAPELGGAEDFGAASPPPHEIEPRCREAERNRAELILVYAKNHPKIVELDEILLQCASIGAAAPPSEPPP